MKKLLSFVLCAVMLFSVCTLAGCDKNEVGSDWKVVTYSINGGDDAITQKVGFSVTRNSVNIKEVWLNVKEIKGDSVKLSFQKYSTKTTDAGTSDFTVSGSMLGGGELTVTAKQVREANKNAKGWIKLNSTDWNQAYSNVIMQLTGNITIREIVFVDMNGKRLTAAIDKAFVIIEKDGEIQKMKVYTSSELLAFGEVKNGIPNNLLDSQESFELR